MSAPNDDRVVLVTGGGRGLGPEIARQLVSGDEPHTVVVAARDAQAAAATAKELGERAWPLTLDVTDPESVQAAVEAIDRRHGRLDALVNNAAVNFDAGADPVTEDLEIVDGAWRTNVLAPWRLTQACARLLRAGRERLRMDPNGRAGCAAAAVAGSARTRAASSARSALRRRSAAGRRGASGRWGPAVRESVGMVRRPWE
jgi:NAD(P)-dependent dehydrogenase (short-subunit alcohol dehydrogenase family)